MVTMMLRKVMIRMIIFKKTVANILIRIIMPNKKVRHPRHVEQEEEKNKLYKVNSASNDNGNAGDGEDDNNESAPA